MARVARSRKASADRPAPALPDAAEATLGNQFHCGEIGALEQIWGQFCPGIRHRIEDKYMGLLPRDMVEQIVIEAIAQAWQHHADYEPAKSPLGAWLLLLADHRAADFCDRPYMRARRLELPLAPEQLEAVLARCVAGAGVEDEEGGGGRSAQLCELVHAGLSTLPAAERDVLLADACSPAGHLSSACLAAEQGVTAEAIRQRRRRGKLRLATELRRLGVEKILFGNGSAVFKDGES